MFAVSPGTWDSAPAGKGEVSAAQGAAADPSGFTADTAGVLLCWEEEQSLAG